MNNFSGEDEITAVLADLNKFRHETLTRVAEWEKKKGGKSEGNALVSELAAVLLEADGLSRLMDSILDGTEEMVPVEDLRARVVELKLKANVLVRRWKAFRDQGIGF